MEFTMENGALEGHSKGVWPLLHQTHVDLQSPGIDTVQLASTSLRYKTNETKSVFSRARKMSEEFATNLR
eukprot:3029851-Pleurochrysis_carterae.AAC.5